MEKYKGRQIDEGSYGAIYEVKEIPSLVIKSLRANYTDPEDRRCIKREIHCLNKLIDNPNVIEIVDFFSYDKEIQLMFVDEHRQHAIKR